MTNSDLSSQAKEFTDIYQIAALPVLPPRFSDYRFLSCLSESPKKKTFLLESESGRKVLCKYASGEYVSMLQTEGLFYTHGKFPFVPYVFDYFSTEDEAWLLREYIEGETLSDIVERQGAMPFKKAAALMEQVCNMISCLHASKPPIIHRDLKPSNILLSASGDCYLIDLGTVRDYRENADTDTLLFGTPGIAAPEQFGARQTDSRTDIYALGILFYYLLTGELRIEKNKLKKLPRKAASLIEKCTAFDPDMRCSHVSEIQQSLHSLLTEPKVSGMSNGWIFGIAGICCALFAGAALLFSHASTLFSKEVFFSSSLLEEAVRLELGKGENEPVYEYELAAITRLHICGYQVIFNNDSHIQFQNHHTVNGIARSEDETGDIRDISLLAKMPNLHYLTLDFQDIEDISPLQDLPLVSLSLCGNPIEDLSPLAQQDTLASLYLSGTNVSSLEALSTCTSLELLDISYSQASSLAPLSGLPISTLLTIQSPIEDWEVLPEMSVSVLICGGSKIDADVYEILGQTDSLRSLTLQRCGITSLKELSALSPSLTYLDLAVNSIRSLDGLEAFPNLNKLILTSNPLTDGSALASMRNLQELSVGDTHMDFSVLNELPYLSQVRIYPSQQEALLQAVPEPWFSVSFY